MESKTDMETRCGLFGWFPSCLQRFANMWSYTIFNSIASLLTSTLSVYIGSQVPALEKQFGMSSYQTGLLMSFNDIGFLTCCLFVTSVARYVHIPRFMFLCFVLYGVSGILCALPHFLTPEEEYSYQPGKNLLQLGNATSKNGSSSVPLCVLSNYTDDVMDVVGCSSAKAKRVKSSTSEATKNMALTIIAIGMLFQGIGKAPRGPFTTVYVDDNVNKRKTGYFIGIMSALGVFGAALAYGLGAVFSKIYVTLEDVAIGPRDPRWIGAWWLGFMVFGLASIIFAVPILLFPRRLADAPDNTGEQSEKEHLMTTKEKVKDRVLSYYRVLKNPIYVSVLVTNVCQLMSIAGYLSFLSKYIKIQWTIPLWQANIVLGASNLVSISFGIFIGGVITRKFRMTPRNAFRWLLSLFTIQIAFFIINTLLGCDQPTFVGPKSVHGADTVYLNTTCGDACGCRSDEFFPICGSNGLNYHSPCYAGCTESEKAGTTYSNCTCIPDGKAVSGQCDSGCGTLWFWAVSNFMSSMVGSMKGLISFIVKIRCVDDKDKSTAIGLQSFLLALLAFMPAPIIYGRIVDSTCMLWQSCGNSGACVLHDLFDFRLKLHLISLTFQVIASLSTAFALWWTWKWRDWSDRKQITFDVDKNILITKKKIQGQSDIIRVEKPV